MLDKELCVYDSVSTLCLREDAAVTSVVAWESVCVDCISQYQPVSAGHQWCRHITSLSAQMKGKASHTH